MSQICPSRFSIEGHLLFNLSYADSIVINDFREKLQESLNCLATSAAKFGLQVNVSKTKCKTTVKTNHTLNVSIYYEQTAIGGNISFMLMRNLLQAEEAIDDDEYKPQRNIGLGL